jgi:hypothetical protein
MTGQAISARPHPGGGEDGEGDEDEDGSRVGEKQDVEILAHGVVNAGGGEAGSAVTVTSAEALATARKAGRRREWVPYQWEARNWEGRGRGKLALVFGREAGAYTRPIFGST